MKNNLTNTLENRFTQGSLPLVFLKTALPIIIIMLVNGTFTLVDAYFLGTFVGADALTAVTSMFPAFMTLVALSTLVSNGFSSVIARLLGAGEQQNARNTFAQAITLSLMVCAVLIALFLLGGQALAVAVSNGSILLSELSYTYISILVFSSPVLFILTINSDSLRCEGQITIITVVSLISVLLNALFNYLFIVQMNLGVAGSAYGTLLAQTVSLIAIMILRHRSANEFNMQVIILSTQRNHWRDFLTLGAPTSLTYVGVALSSAAILYNLQQWHVIDYSTTVGAYGIITRLMTFIFLPLLGLSIAFQTILGNNVGAKQWQRANSSIKIALLAALCYCLLSQATLLHFRSALGSVFVHDINVQMEVARILPFSTLALFLFGPLMMVSMLFQAIGDAKRAGILSLVKTYVFALPLIFILPNFFSETGIWYAGPTAEFLTLLLTLAVLYQRNKNEGNPKGLFFKN